MNIRSLADALAYVEQPAPKRGRSWINRPVAHATVLQPELDGGMSVRYHDTDVVTYHRDGSITLRSGGWLTKTTLARLNAFTPDDVRVWQDKRWWVGTPGPATYPFTEGMTLHPVGQGWVPTGVLTPLELAQQDDWNEQVRKHVRIGLRRWREKGSVIEPNPCTECMLLAADQVHTNNGHLWAHILVLRSHDPALPQDLLLAVGATVSRAPYRCTDVKRIGAFLRNRLYAGAVSGSVSGRRPITAPARSTAWQSRSPA